MDSRYLDYVHRDPDADLLVITNMWPEDGRPVYGIFVERQVQALRRAGVRCDVLYLRGYLSKLAYIAGVPRFLWLTRSARSRYKLVHIHAGETALAARFLLARPTITSYHGDDVLGFRGHDGQIPLRSKLRSLFVRRHARLFTATITQSREMHLRLPRRVQTTDTVIRCGVDATQFTPKDLERARRELGWNPNDAIVLFAATRPHYPLKRLDLAEAAVTHAETLVGAIRLIVAENVSPDSMPTMMSAADCLLVSSMSEGSPMVVKEALMCNLPVVATDVGDIAEILENVTPSALCKHEPRELGEALASVVRHKCRSNGRSKLVQLDQAMTVRQLLNVYGGLGVSAATRTEDASIV